MNITHEISSKYKMQGNLLVDHLQGPHLPHTTPFQPNLHCLSFSLSINIIFFFVEIERYSSSCSGFHGAWIQAGLEREIHPMEKLFGICLEVEQMKIYKQSKYFMFLFAHGRSTTCKRLKSERTIGLTKCVKTGWRLDFLCIHSLAIEALIN